MKTIFGVLSLLILLTIGGVLAGMARHEMTIAAGGSSAVIDATTTGSASPKSLQNREHTVEAAVEQGQRVTGNK